MIGRTMSHYKILEKIGGGGMGIVYRAQDIKLDRFVALKFLPPELTRDPEAKERFIREAKAASSLQHNNICTVHDIDQTAEGQMFIVMDCYEGETLRKKIAGGPMRVEDVGSIAVQIAEGLARAHGKGIVHRDIKPANVLVTNDGIVKIVDFGLAKFIGSPHITREGKRPGTTMYMSPEQLKGEAVDERTDIWSFGVLLYQMLTGVHPFEAEFDESVMYRIISDELVPVATLQPGVPRVLADIVMHCLEKDKAKRPQSMDEVLMALGQHASVHTVAFLRKRIGRMIAIGGFLIVAAVLGAYLGWDLLFPPHSENMRIAVLMFIDETKDTTMHAVQPEIQRLFTNEFLGVKCILVENRNHLNAGIANKFFLDNPPRTDDLFRYLRQQGYDHVVDGSITSSVAGGIIIEANLLEGSRYQPVQAFQAHLVFGRQLDSVVQILSGQVLAYLRTVELDIKPELGIWRTSKPKNWAAVAQLWDAYAYYCASEMQSANAALWKAVELDSTFISPRVWLSSYYRRYDPEGAGRRNLEVLLRLKSKADKFEQVMIDWSESFLQDKFEDQVHHLRQALAIEPTNRVLLANLAGTYAEMHDTVRALDAYRWCVESRWEFKPFYQLAVLYYLGLRKYDSAKVTLDAWREVDTASVSPLLYGWLSAVHLRVGDIAQAMNWREKFIAVCGDSSTSSMDFALGSCYADAGMLQKGDSLVRYAIALEKNNSVYREKLGTVLLANGDMDSALRELSVAYQLNPKSKRLMLKLGNIFKQKGDTLRALEHYKKFLLRDSTSYDSQQIQKWIKQLNC